MFCVKVTPCVSVCDRLILEKILNLTPHAKLKLNTDPERDLRWIQKSKAPPGLVLQAMF